MYNRLVASTDPGWIQSTVDTPTGIFGQVGLQTNVHKTVGMVCEPCQAAGVQVRQVLHTSDDRVGTEFQGETEVTGSLHRVQEGIVEGVTGGAPPNPARHGERGAGVGG